MIFVNATAWPTLLEKLQQKKKLSKYAHEMERAEHFVKQLDVIVDFVSSVISNINEINNHEDDLSDWELEDLFKSDSSDDERERKMFNKYMNPLQLYSGDGL